MRICLDPPGKTRRILTWRRRMTWKISVLEVRTKERKLKKKNSARTRMKEARPVRERMRSRRTFGTKEAKLEEGELAKLTRIESLLVSLRDSSVLLALDRDGGLGEEDSFRLLELGPE